jgi:hypothetical protein
MTRSVDIAWTCPLPMPGVLLQPNVESPKLNRKARANPEKHVPVAADRNYLRPVVLDFWLRRLVRPRDVNLASLPPHPATYAPAKRNDG